MHYDLLSRKIFNFFAAKTRPLKTNAVLFTYVVILGPTSTFTRSKFLTSSNTFT